jgi:hypothetical protein
MIGIAALRAGHTHNPARMAACCWSCGSISRWRRAHCEEAIEVIAECMRHKDARVRLLAASIMLERGYGKPEQKSDASVTHKFALVPEVMPKDEWLKYRGQPQPKALPPPDPDRKRN